MSKATKQANLEIGYEEVDILIAQDHEVRQFDDYHFRINRRLDVWPSTKKWYDTWTKRTGTYRTLMDLVKEHFPRKAPSERTV